MLVEAHIVSYCLLLYAIVTVGLDPEFTSVYYLQKQRASASASTRRTVELPRLELVTPNIG